MLPTRPRLAARSTTSSCTWPAESTATRVSCGVTLTSISSLTLRPHTLEQLGGFVQRQAHDARETAPQLDDELRGAALDRVAAGLVVALAGGDVLADLVRRQRLELDLGDRQHAFELRFVLDCHRG